MKLPKGSRKGLIPFSLSGIEDLYTPRNSQKGVERHSCKHSFICKCILCQKLPKGSRKVTSLHNPVDGSYCCRLKLPKGSRKEMEAIYTS